MSTLRRQDSTGPSLKRIACAQVESAIRFLTRQAGQGVAAEQAIDQVRAMLALIEPDLPRPVVRRDLTILDRLSEGLAELTEPTLLAEQLDRQYKKSPSDSALASAVKTLRKRWAVVDPTGSAMSSKAGSFNPAIYRLVADMAELRGHLGDWPVDAIPSDQPPRGLRRTYTRARKLSSEPITASTLADLHKALVELIAQLSVINKACSTMIKAQRKLITRSADALQNLILEDKLEAALRAELGENASEALPETKPLDERAVQCAGSDLDQALAETPAAMMKRMQAYWTAWRSGSD